MIPFQREMNAINIQCDSRLFDNAPNSNAQKKREPRNPEDTACLKIHLNLKQIGNETIIMLMIIICMCYKKSKPKIKQKLICYLRTSIFVCVFSCKSLQGAKNCLSQFRAAPRPPYEPFQRIQVPPAESGWLGEVAVAGMAGPEMSR